MSVFEHRFTLRAPLTAVWQFHIDPAALPEVMPGPMRIRVDSVDRPVAVGSTFAMRLGFGPLSLRWRLRVIEFSPRARFVDEQIGSEGPFKAWRHEHAFEARSAGETLVIDHITYQPPLGLLGRLGDALIGRAVMNLMFAGRRRETRKRLENMS